MCASRGTKLSLMKEAVSSSPYDSASSRAHAPQAGAALKSTSTGFFAVLASASAASASLIQFTFMGHAPPRSVVSWEYSHKKAQNFTKAQQKLFCEFCAFLWLERDGLFGPELEFAVFVDFGFRFEAVGYFNNVVEYAPADFIDCFRTVDDTTGIEIQIV